MSVWMAWTHRHSLPSLTIVHCSVKTDLQPGGAISRLYIANANRRDSGNFTCASGDTAHATVLVHVLNGEWSQGLYCSAHWHRQGTNHE